MTIDYKAWDKHFKKTPRSTEVVEIPKDVFDFFLETQEAYVAFDGGDSATLVSCQLLALDLLRKIAAHHDGTPAADV